MDKQNVSIYRDHDDTALLLEQLNDTVPMRQIEAAIEKLTISADAKALLVDMSLITLNVGKVVLSLGKTILTFVIGILKRFPNTAFGIVIGVTVSILVGGIPLVGAVLGPLLGKLVTVFGLTMRAVADFKDAAIRSEIAALERKVAIVVAGG